jgi:hypothetical protein
VTDSGTTGVDTLAVLIRRGLSAVIFVIAALSFAFGFGNGWLLGRELGVPGWIAPLVAPAVDLSVAALLVSLQYLRSRGLGDRLYGPRLLLIICGLITFALNTMHAILAGAIGRACFDAIAPLLLIGWSEVGPRLLALLHRAVRDGSKYHQDEGQDERASSPNRPGPSPEIMEQAIRLDSEYRQMTGRAITRDRLRAGLRVSNAVAGEVLKELWAESSKSVPSKGTTGRELSTGSPRLRSGVVN